MSIHRIAQALQKTAKNTLLTKQVVESLFSKGYTLWKRDLAREEYRPTFPQSWDYLKKESTFEGLYLDSKGYVRRERSKRQTNFALSRNPPKY
tara:strand:- start:10363 stop:10641 length:279 start_codon:yes stop_codon:yes gene_type:complete